MKNGYIKEKRDGNRVISITKGSLLSYIVIQTIYMLRAFTIALLKVLSILQKEPTFSILYNHSKHPH